jgi:hypothetical protein
VTAVTAVIVVIVGIAVIAGIAVNVMTKKRFTKYLQL